MSLPIAALSLPITRGAPENPKSIATYTSAVPYLRPGEMQCLSSLG